MLKGSIVALITPFQNDQIDERAFEDLLNWHISEGTSAILVCGSTGESMTMNHREQADAIELAVKIVDGRVPVVAGTSAIDTKQTVSLTQQAEALGADAALIVAPPYIKPSQTGLYHHYSTVAGQTKLPILLYNNPGRSVVNIDTETVIQLAGISNIIGLKDACPDIARTTTFRRVLGPDFLLFSGEDGTAAAYLAQGGNGCISVTANVAPKLCAQLQQAWQDGDLKAFAHYRNQLDQLNGVLFIETNPCPVKYAVSYLGKCQPHLRAPLQLVNENTQQQIQTTMRQLGLVA